MAVLALLFAWTLSGCNAQPTVAPAPTTTPGTGSNYPSSSAGINANGVLLPAHRLELSFGAAGRVDAVLVGIGESVQAGQILAALNATEAQLVLQQAEVELAAAQADYNQAASGLETDQRSAALELIEAQQALDGLYENVGVDRAAALQEIVEASSAVEQASYLLYYLSMPASLAGLGPVEALSQAQERLEQARLAYEPFKYASSGSESRSNLKEKLDQAQSDYNAAVRRMELEAALADARARLEKVKANYQELLAGPDPDQVALAEARLAKAQAQWAQVEAGEATVDSLALAQAHLDSARLNLEIARSHLDQMTIVAPIDGVVSSTHIDAGEWAAPGVAVIEVLDLSGWYVETRNVGELQIGRVQIDQEVRVRVNAFRDQILSGRVISISPDSVTQQGDITYTLMIELELTELNLRPGMTAQVEILLEE